MGRFLAGKSQSCARPQACHIKATLNPKLHPLKSPVPYAPKHSALVEVWMLSHRSDTRLPGSGHPHVLPESHSFFPPSPHPQQSSEASARPADTDRAASPPAPPVPAK